jgi:ribosome biogenesis GTPase A
MAVINYFPGHMKKTYDELPGLAKISDLIIYLLDARCPNYSLNTYTLKHFDPEKLLFLLTKKDLADQAKAELFLAGHRDGSLLADLNSNADIDLVRKAIDFRCEQKRQRQKSRKKEADISFNILIIGIPNAGKSTLINRLLSQKKAAVMNLPGVTKNVGRYLYKDNVYIFDTPGILFPKMLPDIGRALCAIGSVKTADEASQDVALYIINILRTSYPDLLSARYRAEPDAQNIDALLENICRSFGLIKAGNACDFERLYSLIISDVKGQKIKGVNLEQN